jgi:signal transduction histidine kinase
MEQQGFEKKMAMEADMAHEFQTPLAILRGNLEILENEDSVRNRRALRVMAATIDRLSRLVGRTLERARDAMTGAGGAAAVSVSILLEESYDECASLAENRGIIFSIAGSVPAYLYGDKDQLKEVLLNVIANAFQHTRAGGSVICSARAGGRGVAIEVCDTGSGIAEDDLDHIFDRFYRIGERREGCLRDIDAQGTGLGLAICREIIAAHGGTIHAESELGKGSRFIIQLPRTDASNTKSETGG